MGRLGVLAGGIDPFAPPPLLRFIKTAAIVIPRQVVDVFATVLLQYAELADDLRAFRIFGRIVGARHVTKVQPDVPPKTGRAFGLTEGGGQTFPSSFLITAHMSI